MASRTLFQLFTLSIIFTKQTETRTLNETSNFAKNQIYSVISKTDVSNRNGTVPMKGIYTQQRVYTSPESKHDIEFRNKRNIEQMPNEEAVAGTLKAERQREIKPSNNDLKLNTKLLPEELIPLNNSNHFSKYEKKYIEEDSQMNSINNDLIEALALKTAIEKVKQELSETKYKLNDESLQNAAKEYLTHTKPVPRLKYSTTRHHKTSILTTQSTTENTLTAEVDNGMRKIEFGEKRNHKAPEKRENDIYELKRPNEFKIASKDDKKLTYIDNKSSDVLSQENEQYELKHVEDTSEVWVSKHNNLEYTTKYKQKKRHLTDKPIQRLKHLTTRHRNTNTRTIQSMTENSLIAEVDNGILKTEHRDKINHNSPEKRENDIYELQRSSEFKIVSKHINKLKYIDNKNHDALSLENEHHELKHVDDTAEVRVSKQINLEYTPKYKQKKKHLTDKPIQQVKHLTSRHNTNTRTTQPMTENSLIAEVDNGIRKIEHREKSNQKTPEKRENDIYELKRPSKFKIASKHDNKLKYNDNKNHDALSLENEQYELKHVDDTAEVWVSKQINLEYTPKDKSNFYKRKHHDDIVTKDKYSDKTKQNSTIKHVLETYQDKYKLAVKNKDEDERILDSGDTLKPDEVGTQTLEKHTDESRKTLKRGNKGSKLKHHHNKKSDTMSLENEIYTLKNKQNDFQKEKLKVSKHVTKINKPIFSQNIQKKKYDGIANKNKHIVKPKNKSEEVISNIYKGNLKNKPYFITDRHTNTTRKDERIFDSRDKKRDKLKVDDVDIRTVTKLVGRQANRQADEDATLDSYEDPFKQNNNFILPFYISTTTLGTKDKDCMLTKKKRETKTLLDDLNTVLKEKKSLNNDILNQTINRLVSSKIFDVLTDTVAGKMLKKLQTIGESNLLSKHEFKAKMEEKPGNVEQIGILFEKNGEMQVVMSRENEMEIEKNKSGDIESFYLK